MVQTQIQGGDTRISQLPNATNLYAADLFVIVQSGQAMNLTAQQVANFILSIGPVTIIGGTLNNVTIGNITPGPGTFTSFSAGSISGAAFATGIPAFLATPNSANLAAAVTDETGTGALVFANGPTLIAPILGTPASGTLSNTTSYPIARDIHAATSKAPLALADEFGIWDSVSGTLQKSTWSNILSQMPVGITYADAGGTSDAITATYTIPGFTNLTDGLDVTLGITTPNTTNAPTFTPTINGVAQTTHTIFKYINNIAVPLAPGDLQGDVWLLYDLPNTRWILNTPRLDYIGNIYYADAGGTSDAITATYNVSNGTLRDGYDLTVGIATPNTTATPTFAPTLNGAAQTARTIVRYVGGASSLLSPGDLQGHAYLKYDAVNLVWILLNPATPASQVVAGTFKNLQLSATGIDANVSITADELILENSSGYSHRASTVSLTINSAGAGANGLDTGTLAASTWYSVWAIYNPTTLTTAGLISTSFTAPTLPSGYTFKCRVGATRTDGTANKYPLSFKQLGRYAQYVQAAGSNITSPIVMASGAQGSPTTPTWVAIGVSNFVPSTASRIMGIIGVTGGANADYILAPNNSYGAVSNTTNPPPYAGHPSVTTYGGVYATSFNMLLESTNVYWATVTAAGTLFVLGWEDNL